MYKCVSDPIQINEKSSRMMFFRNRIEILNTNHRCCITVICIRFHVFIAQRNRSSVEYLFLELISRIISRNASVTPLLSLRQSIVIALSPLI